MEIWKEIPNTNGAYEVSNKGNVRTYYKRGTNKVGLDPKNMKIQTLSTGYSAVCIHRRNKLVHRLVAKAFIDNPKNKRTVNHRNGIKSDNRVENLEWATYSENHAHAFKNGIRSISEYQKNAISKSSRGSNNSISKLTEKDIPIIRTLKNDGLSNKEIGNIFNVSRTTIYDVVEGQTWKHV